MECGNFWQAGALRPIDQVAGQLRDTVNLRKEPHKAMGLDVKGPRADYDRICGKPGRWRDFSPAGELTPVG